MTNAEQWLADLEAKAKAAIDTAGWGDMDWSGAHEDFFYAATPEAVLRLVSIVREYDAEATRYKKALEWALINRLYIYPDCGGSKCFRKKGESCTLSYVERMTRRILEDSASGERPMMNAARGAVKLLREVEQTAKS